MRMRFLYSHGLKHKNLKRIVTLSDIDLYDFKISLMELNEIVNWSKNLYLK